MLLPHTPARSGAVPGRVLFLFLFYYFYYFFCLPLVGLQQRARAPARSAAAPDRLC
jgi:hypothetical protein